MSQGPLVECPSYPPPHFNLSGGAEVLLVIALSGGQKCYCFVWGAEVPLNLKAQHFQNCPVRLSLSSQHLVMSTATLPFCSPPCVPCACREPEIGPSFTVQTATLTDSGAYQCIAYNLAGHSQSATLVQVMSKSRLPCIID